MQMWLPAPTMVFIKQQNCQQHCFLRPLQAGSNGLTFDSRLQDARRAPCTEHNLKIGDTVLGRVVRSQGKGSNIELVDDPRIIG